MLRKKEVFVINSKSDYEYDQMYKLGEICYNQVVLDNIFNFLRLRDSLAEAYNEINLPNDIKSLWVQNIMIISASLIEALLKEAFFRLKAICQLQRCDGNSCSLYQQLIKGNVNKDFDFYTLIQLASTYGMFRFSKNLLHEIRKIRNNIHISKSNVQINTDERMQANSACEVLEIFDNLVLSLHSYFNNLGSSCFKEQTDEY